MLVRTQILPQRRGVVSMTVLLSVLPLALASTCETLEQLRNAGAPEQVALDVLATSEVDHQLLACLAGAGASSALLTAAAQRIPPRDDHTPLRLEVATKHALGLSLDVLGDVVAGASLGEADLACLDELGLDVQQQPAPADTAEPADQRESPAAVEVAPGPAWPALLTLGLPTATITCAEDHEEARRALSSCGLASGTMTVVVTSPARDDMGSWSTRQELVEGAVYVGDRQLEVDDFLALAGTDVERAALQAGLDRTRTLRVAGVGVMAASVAAALLLPSDAPTAARAALGGAALGGGAMTYAGALEKGRLTFDPAATLGRPEVAARILEHNDRLAAGLGLEPVTPLHAAGAAPPAILTDPCAAQRAAELGAGPDADLHTRRMILGSCLLAPASWSAALVDQDGRRFVQQRFLVAAREDRPLRAVEAVELLGLPDEEAARHARRSTAMAVGSLALASAGVGLVAWSQAQPETDLRLVAGGATAAVVGAGSFTLTFPRRQRQRYGLDDRVDASFVEEAIEAYDERLRGELFGPDGAGVDGT